MKIAVTGREGQVVRSLIERSAGGPHQVVAVGRPEMDLADAASVEKAIADLGPDMVVSAAAYTAVDQAEDEPELAFRINADGAGAVARAARLAGAPVVHLSTDYVFSGTFEGAYDETMPTGPRGTYGRSKLAGEEAVAAANPRHLVLRTAWVYSPFGRNFVKTMLGLAQTRDEVRVVDDQRGNPTSALDIADALLAVADGWSRQGRDGLSGVYHLAGSGETTWCGFAAEIFRVSAGLGGPSAKAIPIGTSDFPTKAVRPANSRLDSTKFARDFGYRSPSWRDSTAEVVARLVAAPGR